MARGLQSKSSALTELSQAVLAFKNSTRYEILKGLKLGVLLAGAKGFGDLDDLSFEELVELGSKGLAKRRWLSPPDLKRLTKLLTTFVEAEQGVPENPLSRKSKDRFSDLSSVASENQLRELRTKLTKHPKFSTISDKKLSDFWEAGSTSAPFEEMLTLSQFANFDLVTLQKKRTFSQTKLIALSKALVKAVDFLNRGAISSLKSEAANFERAPEIEVLLNYFTESAKALTGVSPLFTDFVAKCLLSEALPALLTGKKTLPADLAAHPLVSACKSLGLIEKSDSKELATMVSGRLDPGVFERLVAKLIINIGSGS